MRQELQPVLVQAHTLAPADLPRLLGDLEEVRMVALARLSSPAVEKQPDEMLDVNEAAARMNVSTDYLYRNHRRLSFARRVGRKLLFSSLGLEAYLRQSR